MDNIDKNVRSHGGSSRNRFFRLVIIFLLILSSNIIAIQSSGSNSSEKTAVAPKGSQETNAAQQVINYFLGVFENDWNLGFEYNESRDGMGFAQSYDIYSSGYKDYSRPPKGVSGAIAITPILSPDNSYNQTLKLIESANNTLFIEQMYIQEGLDELIKAIVSAKARGVSIEIIVGESGSDQAPLNTLRNAGIPIRVSEENASMGNYFDTMHNKGIIVDGKVVLIASVNWSPNSFFNNREAGVIVENSEVATYYTDLFTYDWNASTPYNPAVHFTSKTQSPSSSISDGPINDKVKSINEIWLNKQERNAPLPSYSYTPTFDAPRFSGQMNVTCLASPDNVFDRLETLLLHAEKSIYISVYTLSSPYLMEALIDRIEHGIDVRLLLEKENVGFYERNYNRWTMMNLTKISHNGHYARGRWAYSSEVEGYQDAAFAYQHCKYAVIDNSTLVISSGNWGRSSCPKPKDYEGDGYANVDGNRDWWFVIYGSGEGASAYSPSQNNGENPMDNLLYQILIGAAAIIVVGIYIYMKRR